MNNFNRFSKSDDDNEDTDDTEERQFESASSEETSPSQSPEEPFKPSMTDTHLHSTVKGPVHTGTGDIHVHYPPEETKEQAHSRGISRFEIVLNYLGQNIKGPFRFTLRFSFIIGSILFIKWILGWFINL